MSKLRYLFLVFLTQFITPALALANPIPIRETNSLQMPETLPDTTIRQSSPWLALLKSIGLLTFVILIEVFTAYLYLKKRKKSLSILWTVGWVNIISLPLAWILMASLAEISMNSLLIVLLVEFLVVVFESFFIYVFNFKHIKYLESIFLTILTNFVSLVIGGIVLYLFA